MKLAGVSGQALAGLTDSRLFNIEQNSVRLPADSTVAETPRKNKCSN